MEMVQNKTGQNKTNVETVWSVYDTLFCEVSSHARARTRTHTRMHARTRTRTRTRVTGFGVCRNPGKSAKKPP